jgi:MoxR-like ATPase
MKKLTQKPFYEGSDNWTRRKPLYQPPIEGSNYDPDGRQYYPYLPTKELQEAVNLAIMLNRPLLVEGEPGCGKSRLAESIAYEFTQKYLDGEGWWCFQEWNVKSVARAKEGLYSFDAVGRLRDAQLIGSGVDQLSKILTEEELFELKNRLKNKEEYISYGPLGKALKQTECDHPIVLIDEIDKADSDFPNDLLRELDRLEFTVTETGQRYPRTGVSLRPRPIVIITSNRERALPEAFLRRCLYFKLDFPNEEQLNEIIRHRFKKVNQDLVCKIIKHFIEIRRTFEEYPGTKPPSTSEILDFLTVLQNKSVPEAIASLEDLANSSNIHLLGVILKTEKDQNLYRQNFGGKL